MKSSRPPILPTKLLLWLASGPHGDALAGDLVEQYREGRSAAWYWRQALFGIIVSLARDRTFGGPALFGSLFVVCLFLVSVGRHPSLFRSGLFIADIALLSGYGVLSAWVWRQRQPKDRDALTAGVRTGIVLSGVLIASHAIEWFALFENRAGQFARGAGSTLLTLGLLGAAGSAAWLRTRSIKLALVAGLWCGSLGALSLLGFALTLNLVFPVHAASWLHEPFVPSGMSDAGEYVVQNSLEAASEILVRMPVAALLLSFGGSLSIAWMTHWPRKLAILAAWFTPVIFISGAAMLWHANSLERSARPPFVMAGVVSAAIALCSAHPIWSTLFHGYSELPPES
jgi:hypothetical protein